MKRNLSKPIIITTVLLAAILGIVFAYTQLERENNLANQKPFSVVTSVFPVTLFVTNLVGQKVAVTTLVPPGIDIHSYELSPGDVRTLVDADMVVLLGNELEPIEDKLVDLINNEYEGNSEGRPVIVSMSDGVDFLPDTDQITAQMEGDEHSDEAEHDEHEEEHEEDEHNHGLYDPHIWLSPSRAIVMTKNLEQALINYDADDATLYQARSTELIARLTELDYSYKATLANCKKDTILVVHNAFNYLGNDYNFNVLAIKGLRLKSEPGPQELAQLSEIAEAKQIKYLFYEENRDDRTAKSIAQNIDATLLPLHTLETKSTEVLMSQWGKVDEKSYYFELMGVNLRNIATALECSVN